MPQVQQTVAVNIVVKGTGDNKTVSSLDAPLKNVEAQAIKAGTAINTHIVGNLQRALLLARQLGGAFGALGRLTVSGAVRAATEEQNKHNSATAAAIARQKQLVKMWNEATVSVSASTTAHRIFASVSNILTRQINTLVKALTSMVGVMAFWTAFITIPQLFARGFAALTKAAIMTADAVQQVQISLAALIASTHEFGGTLADNFQSSLQWAKRAHIEFIRLSADSLATAAELERAYQAFLAGGGERLVKSFEEEIELTSELGAAILTLTGREKASQQLFTEMRAAMEGTAPAGAQLVRFIKSQVGDYDAWLNKIREAKNGLEEFRKILAPFVEAGKAQAVTITGLATSIRGYAEAINMAAVQGGVYKRLQGWLLNIRNALGDSIQELTTFEGGIENLSEPTRNVVDAFANIAALIQIVIERLAEALGVQDLMSDSAKGMVETSNKLVGVTAVLVATVSTAFKFLEALFNIVKAVWRAIQGGVAFVILALLSAVDLIAKTLKELGDIVLGWIPGVGRALDWLEGGTDHWAESATDAFSGIMDDLAVDAQNVQKTFGNINIFGNYYKEKNYVLDQTKVLAAQMEEILANTFKIPEGAAPVAKVGRENVTEQQLRAYTRMQTQLELLRADEDEILKIQIQQAQKATEIYNTFKGAPELRARALALNREITQELIKQANLKVERDTIERLEVSINNIKAGYNEFSAAESKLDAAILDLNHKLYNRTDLLKRAVDLKKLETFETLKAGIQQDIQSSRLQGIVDRSGELVALEYRRDRALLAIGLMQNVSIEQKRELLRLTNEQYNRERDLTREQRRLEGAEGVRELEARLEKLRGRTSEVVEVQAQYLAEVRDLQQQFKDSPIESQLERRLELLRQLYLEEYKRANFRKGIELIKLETDKLREYSSALKTIRDDYVNMRASSEDVAAAVARLRNQLSFGKELIAALRVELDKLSGTEAKQLEERIKSLEAALREAGIAIDDIANPFSKMQEELSKAQEALIDFVNTGEGGFEALKAIATTVIIQIGQGLASAFTSMFQAMMNGESAIDAFRKGMGRMLIQIGEMLVGIAIASLVLKAIPWISWATNVGAALKLLAVGTAMIAAGVALGGGGGQSAAGTGAGGGGVTSEETSRRQQDVLAQQGIYDAINANTEAITNLNTELGRLSKEKGDVLVANAVKSNPNAILKPLTNKVNRSYTSQRNLKTALNLG